MTARRPLVLVNGRRQQLPAGDRLPGAAVDLAGMVTTEAGQVTPADSVEAAIGKLQGQLLVEPWHNRIINGDMVIAQRGTSFAAVTNGKYTLDRWRAGAATTGAVTIAQVADAPSDAEFQYSLRATVATADTSIAAGGFFAVQQFIEGYNVSDLIGRDFTVVFRVRSSKTGTHCVAFGNAGADRTYVAEYTVNAANTWETKTITIPGGLIAVGTWNWTNGRGLAVMFILACGSSLQTAPNAWQTGNFVGSSAQVNCLDTVGNVFAVTGAQLRAGSVAAGFEHRQMALEAMLCERYFQKNYPLPVAPGTTGRPIAMAFCQNSYSLTSGHVLLRTRMRSGPTITPYNDTTGAAGTWRFRPSNADKAVISTSSSETHWEPGGNNGWTAGEYTYALYTADAEL
ncbi:hypothetical protein [Chitiniphilus eburneus]|uniref:Uncharacterized protein n=1 Tax=Chitiniphilus eburneus TaxID=2571148 RepID=A0A4U0P5H3_9NEIS|nr:hypothetical protein [Chitiniphilus eburneus]TJZ62490.1 hypothetical protein FAZ21_19950 [Chitiniphilus eburneus]